MALTDRRRSTPRAAKPQGAARIPSWYKKARISGLFPHGKPPYSAVLYEILAPLRPKKIRGRVAARLQCGGIGEANPPYPVPFLQPVTVARRMCKRFYS